MALGKLGRGTGLLGRLGGASQWAATRATLKQQIQTFGGTPSTSGLSPTFTLGVANASPTITGSLIAATDASFRQLSAIAYVPTPFPDNLGVKFWDVSIDGTSAESAHAYIAGAFEFTYTGQAFEIRCKGSGGRMRLLVDGAYTATNFSTLPSDGNGYYYKVDLGSAASRQIRIEHCLNLGFWGVQKETAATISAPSNATRLRGLIAGDSFIEGTGADFSYNGLSFIAGNLLGFEDMWDSGSGGTGWLQINGSRVALPARLTQDVINRNPDIVWLAMGINDESLNNASGVGAACSSAIASVRSALPKAMIYVVGPWNPSAPSAAPSNRTAIRDALLSVSQGRSGVKFLDPIGVSYTKFDTTHPDTAGHVTLGTWLANQVKADLGLP